MDPIDISSSDSDWSSDDDDEDDGNVTSSSARGPSPSTSRILPPWATVSAGLPRNLGHGESSQRNSFSKVSSLNARPSNVNYPRQARPQIDLNSHDDNRGSSSRSSGSDHFSYSRMDMMPNNFVDVESLDEGMEKFLSKQAPTRLLPPSLQQSSSRAKSKQIVDNVGSSQIRDALGKPSHLAGTSSIYNQTFGEDYFSRDSDGEMIPLDSCGSRMPPPSWVHGRSSSTSQFIGSSDIVHRSTTMEERVVEHDERPVLQAALQDLNQPKIEATLPAGLLSVSLFRHQKIALHWMVQKETKSTHCLGGILADDQGLGKTVSMIALIQMQKLLQSKFKEEDQRNHTTEALNLDDDDDNCESGLEKNKQNGVSENTKAASKAETSLQEFRRRRPAAGTLVVCPATVLRQWAREFCEKVAEESKLSVLIYHGGNRTRDPMQLARYDVVLTTYAIVSNEVPKQPLVDDDDVDQRDGETYGLSSELSASKKRKKSSTGNKKRKKGRKEVDASPYESDSGTLAKVGWFRVILDEAQTIKNHRTLAARACSGLRAKRRWCLSGTPIQNTIDDLYSYFRFLKVDPYCVFKSFCTAIKNPISRNSHHGYLKLRAILTPIMLRRTKDTLIDGEPVINLPKKTIRLSKVDFSTEERAFYLKLEAESRSKFKAYAAAGTVKQNYANILLMLLRLRQACDHPLLVKGFNSDSVGKVSVDMAKGLPKEMLINLLNLLETSLAICCMCSDPPEDAVVTMCGHVFCYQCVSEYLTGDDNMCPAPNCKEQLGADVVFSEATLRSCISDGYTSNSSKSSQNSLVTENECSSSKIRAALEIVRLYCRPGSSNMEQQISPAGVSDTHVSGFSTSTEGPTKAIIFSQWTTMLDLVEISLNQSCVQYRRLDGRMTLLSRDRAVKDFNNDPEVIVMLMSLKAGNLGLNMVAATHVILLDLWWNPTTEDQAVDRAHRIGQTRPVTVTRITIQNTVEDRILALQDEKRKMVASAFGDDQGGGSGPRLTVDDLAYLFQG